MFKSILSTVASVLSSVLAFLGIVSCCGMPVVAGILATLGIGASQLDFLSEYREWFIVCAVGFLLYGFYSAYFKKSDNCSCCSANNDNELRKRKRSTLIQRSILWLGTIITIAVLFGSSMTATDNRNNDENCCGIKVIPQKNSNNCCTK